MRGELRRRTMGWHRLNTAIDQAHRYFRELPSQTTVHVAGRSDVGRVRSHNEDAYIVADLSTGSPAIEDAVRRLRVGPKGVLLAVSDGMGGAAAGEVASAIVIESMLQNLDRRSEDDILAALTTAVERANGDVWRAAQSEARQGMGATLVAAVVDETQVHVVWVGDSRLYLVRDGRIHQVTKDHSYVQMLVDAGALTPDSARRSPYRNIVLQAMGTKPDVRVALARVELRQGDRFVLCSDGITDKLEDPEILEIVEAGASVAASSARLVALANELGGDDNITVIVADVSGDGLTESAGDPDDAFEVVQDFAFV
jgi:PPM family protein phosphatase